MKTIEPNLEEQWTRLGVLFNCEPASEIPDLERLLLATARGLSDNPRLLPLVVTWLVFYGAFVAKHRLKALVAELQPTDQAALGLLLESAVEHKAAADLRVAFEICNTVSVQKPLFNVYQGHASLESLAERTASPLSRRWGLWATEVQLKADAVRPVAWLLTQNPEYQSRVIRKGDLRCSILESLRRDAGGHAKSEAAVAQLSGATRAAVRKALAALVLEGEVVISKKAGNRRDNTVTLQMAA